jgi:putative ABC transport system substrate-binding protein
MKRRDLIIGLPITLLAASGRAFSQPSRKLPRIGVLVSASPPHPFADAFWRGLRPLGYSEGQNIEVEFHYTGGRSERAEELADDLVRRGVDVIVAHFTPAVRAALGATRIIPIVMAPAGAPLQSGFVQSLAHPGGNVTGLSAMDAEIGGKRLQLLRDLIPGLAPGRGSSIESKHGPVQRAVRGGPPISGEERWPAPRTGAGQRP